VLRKPVSSEGVLPMITQGITNNGEMIYGQY
jgi:hypothetical protein